MLLGCMGLRAQNVALSKVFAYNNSVTQVRMNTLSNDYSGWFFNENCWRIPTKFMQVGSGDGLGIVTTPELGFSGNGILLIKVQQIETAATFNVSISKGTTDSKDYVVESGDDVHISAILLKDCLPDTKVTITGKTGKFYIKSIKVYDIGPAVFYESFNYMTNNNNNDVFALNGYASLNSCDYTNTTLSSYVWQTQGAVFVNDNNSYTTPQLSVFSENTNALLTYKYAFGNVGSVGNYSIAQNGVANALQTGSFSGKASKTWYSDKVIVTNLTNTSTLTFSGNNVFFDDILLQPIPSTISEETDNSIYLEVYNQAEQNVKLTRTLTAGIWNTLCLPFNITKANFPNGTELRTLTSATNGEFVFNSVDEVTAGTPFLVKVTSDVVNPVFENVTVQNVEPEAVGNDDYKFCGTYSPINLNIDGTHVFLGTDGAFHKPTADGNRMKGLRAYFIVPKPTNNEQTEVRVSILDEPSAIHSVETDTTVDTGCYDLTGRRHDEQHLTRGLYVRNGKKFFVK